MPAKPVISQIPEDGFSLAYSRKAGEYRFPSALIAAIFFVACFVYYGSQVFLVLAVATACAAYYYFPLMERKPRIGANQYGIFIDGFGLIGWNSVADISLSTYAVRSIEMKELHIKLNRPLERALLVDWRRVAIWRMLMKLPWSMTHDNIVRIDLELFAPSPEDIHATFLRMWRYYRGIR